MAFDTSGLSTEWLCISEGITRTYTHTSSHTHAIKHACVHFRQTNTRARTHTDTKTQTHLRISVGIASQHSDMNQRVCKMLGGLARAVHTHSQVHTHPYTHTHTHTHTYPYTYTHTHTHTHTHTPAKCWALLWLGGGGQREDNVLKNDCDGIAKVIINT